MTEDLNRRCVAALDAVDRLFQDDEPSIVRQTSRWDFEWAKISLVGVRAWQGQMYYSQRNDSRSFDARDSGMAYVLQTIHKLRYPNLKTVIWAHNGHIGKNTPFPEYDRNMGSHLLESLQDSYKAVALISEQADIDWPQNGCGLYRIEGKGTVELLLQSFNTDYLLLDLAFPQTDQPLLTPGAAYGFSARRMVPHEQYDAAVFLAYSRKMAPLAWPSCQ